MKQIFDDMKRHLMQGFNFFSSQIGGKLAVESSISSHFEEKKVCGEIIFLRTKPENQPNEFKAT